MGHPVYKVAIQLDGAFFGYVDSSDDDSVTKTYVTPFPEYAEEMRDMMQARADMSRDYLARKGYPPGPVYLYSVEASYDQ